MASLLRRASPACVQACSRDVVPDWDQAHLCRVRGRHDLAYGRTDALPCQCRCQLACRGSRKGKSSPTSLPCRRHTRQLHERPPGAATVCSEALVLVRRVE